MKNITLSADETLIEHARAYAQAHGTTVNQLIRDYLAQVTGRLDGPEAADEFAVLARAHAGRSPDDWAFDRDTLHHRRTES